MSRLRIPVQVLVMLSSLKIRFHYLSASQTDTTHIHIGNRLTVSGTNRHERSFFHQLIRILTYHGTALQNITRVHR